jgi:hypothetical protein
MFCMCDARMYVYTAVQQVSLDDMILQILLLDKGNPKQFLSKAVNPPLETAIDNSIKYLCELVSKLPDSIYMRYLHQ